MARAGDTLNFARVTRCPRSPTRTAGSPRARAACRQRRGDLRAIAHRLWPWTQRLDRFRAV